MRKVIYLLFAMALIIMTERVTGQAKDSLNRISLLPVPAFGFSPETSTYIGAVVLLNFHLFYDTLTRPSHSKAEFNYTWKKQYITDLSWEVYSEKERYYYQGRITFSKYPDFYFGIGENTSTEDKISFSSQRQLGEISILKSVGPKLFMGLNFSYRHFYNFSYDKGRERFFPELQSNRTAGLGMRLMKDTRNNLLNPTGGRLTELSFSVNSWKKSTYEKLEIDSRYYLTWSRIHTLAFRLLGSFTIGNAPFFDLSLLGGESQVRGYYSGRYRERNLAAFQSEFRTRVYRRWGLAFFGGVSKLNDIPENLSWNYLRPNYGGGLRFLIDRKGKINLRVDYARGCQGSEGFYISFGEAF